MASVKKVCQGYITELDGSKNETQILEEIARVLKLKNTKAPRRPQRVILLGPPGSQTEQHALDICKKYKLVYVQVTQLLKDAIRREGDTQLAHDLAIRLSNGHSCKYFWFDDSLVPDDIIIDLVRERLEKPDCRINGWVLEGCPMTTYQIKQLRELQIVPQVVVAFEMSDASVLERACADKKQEMEKSLNEYRDFLAAAETEYNKFLIRINSEDDASRIYLNFCDALENSV